VSEFVDGEKQMINGVFESSGLKGMGCSWDCGAEHRGRAAAQLGQPGGFEVVLNCLSEYFSERSK
jgi:hypothetical protein